MTAAEAFFYFADVRSAGIPLRVLRASVAFNKNWNVV